MYWSKRAIKLSVAGVLVLAAHAAEAGSILGSAHDFTNYNWSGGQVCITCHDSHSSMTSIPGAPQWNHALSAQSYALYGSATLKASIGQPGILSKLCLSCHDGTVAVDSFGGASGSTYISSANNIGANLKDDHPIGFVYDSALAVANGSLFDPSSQVVTIGSGTQTQTGTIASVILFSGQVECSTCHDVHNKYTVPGPGLLKVAGTGSALCKTCHNK